VLTESDLEINVLEFRQRSFQFVRLADVGPRSIALFARTETESESQFRPKLLHLTLAVPLAWIVYDEGEDVLSVARDGATVPVRLAEPVIEVGAEPAEFKEQGLAWTKVAGPTPVSFVYAPTELKDDLLSPRGYEALGLR